MLKSFKSLLFILLFLTFYQNVNAQQDATAVNSIVNKIQEFDRSSPVEKIYIHFDKPYYASADTIWLKTYVTRGQNQPTDLSKIVYVELYNEFDSLMTQLKLPVIDGGAAGNIPLIVDKYKQGNYYIRAYTQWMLNFGSDYFFYKNIPIGQGVNKKVNTNIQYIKNADGKLSAKIIFKDPNQKILSAKSINWQLLSNFDVINKGKVNTDATGAIIVPIINDPKKDVLGKTAQIGITVDLGDGSKPINTTITLPKLVGDYDVQFFPEGGDLLLGIPQQIGFKAIGRNGLGVPIKGVIFDKNKQKITEFNTSHLGMGSFYLNTEINNTYSAEVSFPDGSSASFKLPEPKTKGITIQTSSLSKEDINVKLIATQNLIDEEGNKSYYVIGQMNGIVYFSATLNIQKQLTAFKIPKTDLPSGLLQITLFNHNSSPVSERLVFVHKPAEFNYSIKSDKPSYGIKQLVKLNISSLDTASFKTLKNFSISVIDESKVPFDEDADQSILSTLLLTSDLKGYVEKPNFYFNNINDDKLLKLDILMLTQGYSRFEYKNLLNGLYPDIKVLPEQGINITGTLRRKTGLPVNKGTLLLTIPDIRFNKQITTSTVGKFSFPDLVFTDSLEVVITGRYNPNPSDLMLMVDGFPEPAYSLNKNSADKIENIDVAIEKYLENNSKQYRNLQFIEEVEFKSTAVKKPSHRDHPALSTLPMMADDEIDASYIMPCNVLTQCLRTKIVGVTYFENNFYITREFNAGSRIPMSIYLNNFLIDFNSLTTVLPSEVVNIQVFLRDPIGQISKANNTSGVLVINTKDIKSNQGEKISLNDLKSLIPEGHTVKYKPKGYSLERKFYVPKYSLNPAELNFTDLRSTVYWNPKLTFNEKGQSNVEFFNADGRGNYKATLEGIDEDGNVIKTVFKYTVK